MDTQVKIDKNRTRFLLPMMDIVKLFLPGLSAISETRYKELKSILLKWPLARALLLHPSSYVKAIRTEPDYEAFVEGTRHLFHLIVSRDEINKALSEQQQRAVQDKRPTPRTADSASPWNSPRAPSFSPITPRPPTALDSATGQLRPIQERLSSLEEKMESVAGLDAKFEAFSNHLIQMIQPLISPAPNLPHHSFSDLSSSDPELDRTEQSPPPSQTDLWPPETSRQSSPSLSESEELPSLVTIEQEPEVPLPSKTLEDHLIRCQRLGQDGWSRIMYKEAEQRFRHGGAFQPLQVNHQFYGRKEDFKARQLERVLCNIQYGVVAQHQAFEDCTKALFLACPQAKEPFKKLFKGEDSKFRSTSQDLVQYLCGKRSEIISQRRNQFLPSEPGLKRQISSIPPSSSHLFAEEALGKVSVPSAPKPRPTPVAPKRKYNHDYLASGPSQPKRSKHSFRVPSYQHYQRGSPTTAHRHATHHKSSFQPKDSRNVHRQSSKVKKSRAHKRP